MPSALLKTPSTFKILDRVINWVLFLLMASMVVIIAAQVWYRFVMNDPLDWSEELGRYLFVWISFMGAAAGIRYQVHLGIDIIENWFLQRSTDSWFCRSIWSFKSFCW